MSKKQSKEDRLLRLSEGRCPIHGILMYQFDIEYIKSTCGQTHPSGRAIVECSRRDCDIKAFEEKAFQDAVLLPEFQYLIA